jgi:hydrogenase maturation protease
MRRSATGGVLVIGYGSDLRGEDCAGRLAADRISRWDCPNLEVMSLHQLGPELVWKIADSRLVVFVDAFAADLPMSEMVEATPVATKRPRADHPVLIKLHPEIRDVAIGHDSDPVTLLLLARELCGRSPQAYMVGIPASRFGIGDELTDETRAAIVEAVDLIKMLSLWKLRTLPESQIAANRHVIT